MPGWKLEAIPGVGRSHTITSVAFRITICQSFGRVLDVLVLNSTDIIDYTCIYIYTYIIYINLYNKLYMLHYCIFSRGIPGNVLLYLLTALFVSIWFWLDHAWSILVYGRGPAKPLSRRAFGRGWCPFSRDLSPSAISSTDSCHRCRWRSMATAAVVAGYLGAATWLVRSSCGTFGVEGRGDRVLDHRDARL